MTWAFHPEARIEYHQGAAFYEECRRGLGAEFSREIESAIGRILEAPERWRITKQDVRHYLAHKFPYAILYTLEQDFILIIAVAHASREPGYWKHRIR
jgi:toxin ParE1/3/4